MSEEGNGSPKVEEIIETIGGSHRPRARGSGQSIRRQVRRFGSRAGHDGRGRSCRRRRGRGGCRERRVRCRTHGRGRQEDSGYQGRARDYEPGSQRGKSPRRRSPRSQSRKVLQSRRPRRYRLDSQRPAPPSRSSSHRLCEGIARSPNTVSQ